MRTEDRKMNEGKMSEGEVEAEEFDAEELAALAKVLYRLELGPMTAELKADGVWNSKFDGLASLLNTAYAPRLFESVRWDALEKAAEVAAEKLDAKLEAVGERKMMAEGEGEWFIGKDGKKRDIAY
jgi:hypothetical protein